MNAALQSALAARAESILRAGAAQAAAETRETRLAAQRLAARIEELKCREKAFEADLALAGLSRRKFR